MSMNYDELYKQLKEEANQALQSKSIDDCTLDFKKAVDERTQEIHSQIDKMIDEIVEAGKLVLSNEKFSETNFSLTKDKDTKTENDNINEDLPFKLKAEKLIDIINGLKKKNNGFSKIIESFYEGKDTALEKLVKYDKDGNMQFKMLGRIKSLSNNKVDAELVWQKTQNQPSYSTLDPNDPTLLKVHGSGCYNYYQTDKFFTDECVYAEFESTVTQANNYFYFGVMNETCVPSSNCMCCTISQCCYIYHEGHICCHGKYETVPEFEYKSKNGAPTSLKVRLLAPEKEVYFQVDDKEEKGPYKLVGTKFKITFGSCNTSAGQIKIVESSYI